MKKIVPFLLLFTLGISIAQYRMASKTHAVQVMQELLPQASRFEPLSQSVYRAYTSSHLIGYISMQKAVGYGGPISVLASYDTNGNVKDVRIIAHSETPSFFQYVINKGFIDTLKGKRADEPFRIGEDLNAVTSASYTSRGIALAVRKGAHELATSELHLPVVEGHGRHFSLAEWLACALIMITLVFNRFRATKKLRPFVLAASFFIIGIWQNSTLNLSNVALLISGRIPPWNEMPSWFLLAIGVLVIILVTGLNLYCYWLCPFGCVTQTIGKLGQFAGIDCNRSLQKRQLAGVDIRLWLAWFSLLLGFIVGNPGISVYEPFGTLFSFRGNTAQWILMAFALLTAVVIDRFWCRFLCPMGAICDSLATLRRKFKGMRRTYATRD
jgi:Na+-translocating ferredoxin:NAD+ oxidoreductase RnfG subunit